MSQEETRELVNGCLAGDPSAMRAFVQEYQGRVFGLCFRMLAQRQDAEDMAQETLIRALRSLRSWDQGRAFEPWLLAIAGNRCRTLIAKRKRRPAPAELPEQVADGRPHPEKVENLSEEVQLALAGLRQEYRQAFQLFHQQEFSYDQIAAALDCPLGTVKTWVHRARRELIARLTQRGVVHWREGAADADAKSEANADGEDGKEEEKGHGASRPGEGSRRPARNEAVL